jgi:FG-GAP-like repeat
MRSEGLGGRSRTIIVPCALALLLVASQASAQSSLKSRRELPVGERPVSAIAGDFDGDGLLDLIGINRSSGSATLLKGFGDGTFKRPGVTVPVGGQPSFAVLADVTNDGCPDLVASNLLSQDVTVNKGNCQGGFGAPISTSIKTSPTDFQTAPALMAIGDWNRDGWLDVATVNTAKNTVSILLNPKTGSGLFGSISTLNVGLYPLYIVAADFNNDLFLDLAVVNRDSNNIQIWRGNGLGGFSISTGATIATGLSPVAMVAADLNSPPNGILDIAVSNDGTDTISVLLGTGNFQFGAPRTLTPGYGPRALAVTDVNNDLKPDLLVALFRVSNSGAIAVYNGNGDGTFAAPSIIGTGPLPNHVVVGDFNKDGSPDVVTANLSGNTLSVLQNLAGAFVQGGLVALPSSSFPQTIVANNFNGGGMDVATANEFSNSVSFVSGNGNGTFAAANSANNTGITPFSMVAVDFNLDGKLDLVTANNGDDTYSTLSNAGTGNFTVTNGNLVGCVGPVGVSSGEISGDLMSIADLAFVCEIPGYICTARGTGVAGAGAFGAPVCTAVDGTPEGVSVGNYSIDALEDVGMALRDFDAAGVAFSDGFGGIRDIPSIFPAGPAPEGIAHGDLNGDGYQDLVVTNTGGSTISAFLGDGGGAFSFPSIDSWTGLGPTAAALGDYNKDGKLDAAVVNSSANNVSLLLGDGFGHFSNAGNFGTRDLPVAIASADFDGDCQLDLAVADNFNDSITILLNRSGVTCGMVAGDPLQMVSVANPGQQTLIRWGLVPGGTYDVIRGRIKAVTKGPTSYNLGAVTCLANDLVAEETAAPTDSTLPPAGDAYFYAIRATVNGVTGNYTVTGPVVPGLPGIPSSGGCP